MECTSERCRIVLQIVVPAAGVVTAITTVAAPLSTVLSIRRNGSLGDNNPYPYAFIFANALVWIVYGFLMKDYFITSPNLFGILFGLFYMHSAYAYASKRQRFGIDAIALSTTFVILVGGLLSNITYDRDTGHMIMGVLSIVILAMFYSSPLSVFYKVIKSWNSIYFHLPLALACLANGALWTIYGFVKKDFFVWGPNLLGAIISILQILCRLFIPSHPLASSQETAHLRTAGSPTNESSSLDELSPII